MILSDSDCIIDFLNGRAPVDGRIERALRSNELAINSVSAFELYFGAPAGRDRANLDELVGLLTVIPLSLAAADVAAVRGSQLAREGRKLDAADLLIAGTALHLGVPLVTRNVRHFSRIDGLALLDPN